MKGTKSMIAAAETKDQNSFGRFWEMDQEGQEIVIIKKRLRSCAAELKSADSVMFQIMLYEIFLQKAERPAERVHQRDPPWNWGINADPSTLKCYRRGEDITV